jgi:hypothetical protein
MKTWDLTRSQRTFRGHPTNTKRQLAPAPPTLSHPARVCRVHGCICSVLQGVFTSHANSKYFFFHPSHRIFEHMHETLNVGKKINQLHSLSVNVETNLLSLVSPWLDKFYQITTKDATVTFHPLSINWTHPQSAEPLIITVFWNLNIENIFLKSNYIPIALLCCMCCVSFVKVFKAIPHLIKIVLMTILLGVGWETLKIITHFMFVTLHNKRYL